MGSLLAGVGVTKLGEQTGVGGGIFGDGSNGTKFQAQLAPIEGQYKLPDQIAAQQQTGNAIQAQLMQQANGQGPNLAGAQLQAAVNANNQQAAGFLASQKGLNPAVAARLAAQQAGSANQQAAGQAGQLQLQQQLGAQQQLGSFNLAQQNSLQQALANQNQAVNSQYATMTNANAGIAGINAKAQNGVLGGIIGGAGHAAAMGGMAHGGVVEGKAQVAGDSPANDTVSKKLSPGEIVIPRSAASDPEKAKSFIDHLMKRKDSSEPQGYSKVLKSHKKLEERIKKLEKKAK